MTTLKQKIHGINIDELRYALIDSDHSGEFAKLAKSAWLEFFNSANYRNAVDNGDMDIEGLQDVLGDFLSENQLWENKQKSARKQFCELLESLEKPIETQYKLAKKINQMTNGRIKKAIEEIDARFQKITNDEWEGFFTCSYFFDLLSQGEKTVDDLFPALEKYFGNAKKAPEKITIEFSRITDNSYHYDLSVMGKCEKSGSIVCLKEDQRDKDNRHDAIAIALNAILQNS